MSAPEPLRVLVMGAVKHDYILHGMAAHPRYELLAVTDGEAAPDWAHARNAATAAALGLEYLPGVPAALDRFQAQVACVTPEVPRHADLSVQAADAGLHIVQDKPLALTLADCDRIVAAVEARWRAVPDVEPEHLSRHPPGQGGACRRRTSVSRMPST